MANPSVDLLLAADVGGTHTRLRLCAGPERRIVREATLDSAGGASFEALVAPWLARTQGRVRAAAIGVAGPVVDGVCRATNLPWTLRARAIASALGVGEVLLVNDLAAIAVGCTLVSPDRVSWLAAGRPPRRGGNVAVINAGTGLGQALLVWDGERHVPSASEGGHASFAPRDDEEVALLAFARARRGGRGAHVSWERVLSGPGLGLLYDFELARSGDREPAAVARALARGDRNAAIARLGLLGRSPHAAAALDRLADLYGAEAGNLALKGLATGGVYLCGNVARSLAPSRGGRLLAAMRDKGRMRGLLARMPVGVVLDERVGLLGATHLAARLATG